MAEETLTIVVRLRNALRAAAEAREVAHSVDEIDDASRRSARGLLLLNSSSRATSRFMPRLASNLNNVSGRLKLAAAAALVGGPALLAVGSSAAGAAAGLGLLGGAAIASAIFGLGGLVAIGQQAVGQLDKVRSAQDAYRLAIEQFGASSDEALTAQARLDAVIAKAGGAPVRKLLGQLDAVSGRYRRLTREGREAFFRTLSGGLDAANRLLPTFARESNRTALVVERGLGRAFQQLSSREQRGNIGALSRTFRGLVGPGVAGGTNLLITLLRYVRVAGPYVVQAARGFLQWTAGLRAASADGDRVNRQVATLVGHARSWWELLTAIGRLGVAVFGATEREGRSLVDTITRGVDRLTAWVNAANASGRSQSSFARWGRLFRTVGQGVARAAAVIVRLAEAALPGLQSGASGVSVIFGLLLLRLQILTAVLEFLGPLVGPLIVAFAAWKVATIALTAAQIALSIAFRLTPLGWVVTGITLVIAALVLMWTHWAGFRNFIRGVWAWIKTAATDTWGWVTQAIRDFVSFLGGVRGSVTHALDGIWEGFKAGGRAAINWVISMFNRGFATINSITPGAIKVAGETVVPAIPDIPPIPLLARGGRITRGGAAIVGDDGPELLRDVPRGAEVAPLDRAGPVRDRLLQPIRWEVDGRVLAEVVVDVSAGLAAGR